MVIVFASRTGNVRRLVSNIQLYEVCHISEYDKTLGAYVLITYTTGFGEVPAEVQKFLDENAENMKAVIASGNKNWGLSYCKSADTISARYNIPILHKVEMSGTQNDIEIILAEIAKLEGMHSDLFYNLSGLPFRLTGTDKDSRNRTIYLVRFEQTGYETLAYMSNIKAGKVKDPYARTIAGVGYIGNATMKGYSKEYWLWRDMLRRCYDATRKDYPFYGARGVMVCERWHSFENFLSDLPAITGYDKEKFLDGDLTLDKDMQSGDQKMYSPDTCVFMTRSENSSFAKLARPSL